MRLGLLRTCGAVLLTGLFVSIMVVPASAAPETWAPWSTDYYDFGEVVGCNACSESFIFTNVYTDPVEATASDPFQAFTNPEFQITADTCDSAAVPVQGTCSVTVEFTAESPQPAISDQLQGNFIDTTTSDSITVPPVELFAGGEPYAVTTLDGTVNFGDVTDGDPPTFDINYDIFHGLNIIDIPPPEAQLANYDYSVISNTCTAPTLLSAEDEEQCTAEVGFDPTSPGLEETTFDMSFENSSTDASVWTEPLELVGVGVPPAALPEAPVVASLPGIGLVVLAGLVWHRRRRSASAL